MTIMRGFSCSAIWQIRSTLVSESIFRCCFGKPSREARIATCCNDSSPVTYNVGICPESKHMVCSSKVDLPAPGLPPIKIAAPGTIPPPSTRSSSLKPLVNRGTSCKSISAKVCTFASRAPA
ncbi:Uncharacterised protein [Vibrio cholerae]|nr:Uncharacterised protein [Vibrio cholerae]CSB46057.1 Uncharacterised protein [Vibrio cholerae]CSB86077.1 Uncharacterised protein [Vibrio cholerae]CSC21368.1 Uncharacterised protein [Vibrio cholerae]CSC62774.1 Uncharacterised protein [Vibrio cholerae]